MKESLVIYCQSQVIQQLDFLIDVKSWLPPDYGVAPARGLKDKQETGLSYLEG